jgi:DNA-nicking Smr family endonuclease
MDDKFFEYPVDGTLDLHMFRPGDVKSALAEYLFECRGRGITHVRIIHGRGQGVLRQIVQSHLAKCPYVREFGTAPDASGWGATIAVLDTCEEGESE